MATDRTPSRLALRATPDRLLADGAWWPRSRTLGDELAGLVEAWPAASGRIVRVLYSPPDWDDHPRSAAVAGRRIKTGSFPKDDTHQLVLTVLGGERFSLDVIPSDAAPEAATTRLQDTARSATPAAHQLAPVGARSERDGSLPAWDNEGGRP